MSDSKNAAWIGKAASLDGKSWCYRVTVRLWSQQWNVYWRWVVCLQSMKICNEYFSHESIRVAKITLEKYHIILQNKKAHCPIQCGWIFSCQGAVCSVLNSLCFGVSWCVYPGVQCSACRTFRPPVFTCGLLCPVYGPAGHPYPLKLHLYDILFLFGTTSLNIFHFIFLLLALSLLNFFDVFFLLIAPFGHN